MTGKHETLWILTADGHHGRLLRVERAEAGGVHVIIKEEIDDAAEEDDRLRAAFLQEKAPGGSGSPGHDEQTRRAHFAKEIAVWLERKAEDLRIERIAVFASDRFLHDLRDAWSPRFAIQVDDHHGDLTHLDTGQLAHHESIADLIGSRD